MQGKKKMIYFQRYYYFMYNGVIYIGCFDADSMLFKRYGCQMDA